MFRQNYLSIVILTLGLMALSCPILVSEAMAQSNPPDTERVAWLLDREGLETLALTGQRFEQGEIGGGGAASFAEEKKPTSNRKGPKPGWTILASLVLPGSGEAIMGHTRGYFMMAADIFAWTQVAKNHNDGKEITDSYYAYADAHYSDERLVEGYNASSTDPERSGEGALYFPGITGNITTVDDLDILPLYVSKEDDRREYYENLGKWDQFIFGWDDYLRPALWGPLDYDYEPTGTISDLRQPWVSKHREYYRVLRDQANDAYKDRDQWLYLNIGLRVFSVLQVAYLNGLLTGNDDSEMEVAGHPVGVIAEPRGINQGTLGAWVSF